LSTDTLLITSPAGPLAWRASWGRVSEVRPETPVCSWKVAHFALRASASAASGTVAHRAAPASTGWTPPSPSPRPGPRSCRPSGGRSRTGSSTLTQPHRALGVALRPARAGALCWGRRLGGAHRRPPHPLGRVTWGRPLAVTCAHYRRRNPPGRPGQEIARLHGYDEFPSRLPKGVGRGCHLESAPLVRRLVGAGCYECFLPFQGQARSSPGLPEGDRRRSPVRLRNP